jgi:hypothetical protein
MGLLRKPATTMRIGGAAELFVTCLQVCVGVKPGALKSNASWYCHECAELKRNGQIK